VDVSLDTVRAIEAGGLSIHHTFDEASGVYTLTLVDEPEPEVAPAA
jgi:hypothetical protein